MDKTIENIVTLILSLILIAAVLGISWIAICGVIKLITLCFGLSFSWAIATGIWLVLLLCRWVIGAARNKE